MNTPVLEHDYITKVICMTDSPIVYPWVSYHWHIMLRVHIWEKPPRGETGRAKSETTCIQPEVTNGRNGEGPERDGENQSYTLACRPRARTQQKYHLSVHSRGVIYGTRGEGGPNPHRCMCCMLMFLFLLSLRS